MREDANRPGDARNDCIRVAAEFVAAQPGGADRTLARHHRRTDGTCAGCLGALTPWPCTVAVIADMAHRLG